MLTKLHQRGPAQLRSAEIEIVHQTVLDFDNEWRGERARLGELIAQCVGVGESIDLARCRKLCAVICGMGADPAHSAVGVSNQQVIAQRLHITGCVYTDQQATDVGIDDDLVRSERATQPVFPRTEIISAEIPVVDCREVRFGQKKLNAGVTELGQVGWRGWHVGVQVDIVIGIAGPLARVHDRVWGIGRVVDKAVLGRCGEPGLLDWPRNLIGSG